MAKIDKAAADAELEKLLSSWCDGLELPERPEKPKTPEEKSHVQAFDLVSKYIQAGLIHVQDKKLVMKNGEHDPIEFEVPKGEALMNMGDLDITGYLKFAASMAKRAPSFFANTDANSAKRAGAVAVLFMQLP